MAKVKLLLVEDEYLVAMNLMMELQDAGYATAGPVASGQEAITRAREENPDVILIDIRLKGTIDGIEAAMEIAAFSHAKIIFATGYNDPDIRERAMILNPLGFLTKPVIWQDIKELLTKSA